MKKKKPIPNGQCKRNVPNVTRVERSSLSPFSRDKAVI